MNIRFLPDHNPIQRVPAELKTALISAQDNVLDNSFTDSRALLTRVIHDVRLTLEAPDDLSSRPVRWLADKDFKSLVAYFTELLQRTGSPPQVASSLAETLAERTQLVAAFDDPDRVIEDVRSKIARIVVGFPRSAKDIQCGRNPGDVLDPYMLAATQTLMFGGDFEPTIQSTVAHKAMMMIEGLLGHLHEDVVGNMRGNIRAPEPRGEDQETLNPETNPFPGADVVQPPHREGAQLRFHQVKSKTGSAKGGDGRRLGEQLKRLQDTYGGEILYHALIGNTLRGHRSRAGVERAAPGVVVLVGAASFKELTGSNVGAQLLLRLYQSAFKEVAKESGYRVDVMAAEVVTFFKERAEQEGEGFLEVILRDATSGTPEEQDSRAQTSNSTRKPRR